MDTNFEYFKKFIVKQIVNTVDYNPETDEYEINRIHISDDIINIIEEEGIRYGLERGKTDQLISQVAENIRATPAIQLRYDNVTVSRLEIGQHIKINIQHPEKGRHFIELLVTNKNFFFVLSSDIAGLNYGDILHALDETWNNGFYIDFTINNHSVDTIVRLGKLESIEEYSPSVVHEILDSESSFTYESRNDNREKSGTDNKCKDKEYCFWYPNRWKPITFCWEEGYLQNRNCIFIIKDNEDTTKAEIVVNKDFALPSEETTSNALIDIISGCCKCMNKFDDINQPKSIKTIKPGIVKRTLSEPGYKEWELISKPQITFVYG